MHSDFGVLISFAATNKRLTNGSRETLNLAREMIRRYPNILIFGGTYFKNSEPDIEQQEKQGALGDQFIWVGKVSSTTDECEAIKKEVQRRKIQSKDIIIADEEYHSLRTEPVWNHYFPEATLSLQLTPGKIAADPENPMPSQRYWQTWLLANVVFAPTYKYYPGVEWWARRNFNQSFE
jgi:hypothetical protein